MATYSEPEVSDADVDERIEAIRERKAEYVNEDPRPLADGDYALVSLESLEGVEEKISQDEIMLKIGDESTLAGFSAFGLLAIYTPRASRRGPSAAASTG